MDRKRIDELGIWGEIAALRPENLPRSLNAARIGNRRCPVGGGLSLSWAAVDVDDQGVALLEKAAGELGLLDQYRELLKGAIMNQGEQRMVLHHALRGAPAGPVVRDGKDYTAFYAAVRARVESFAAGVRSGSIRGSTGEAFATVVQIGIGGSDLGPRALYLALEDWARARGSLGPRARFISNVDPDDANAVLADLDPEKTLFVLVSKSGTTQETLANETLARAWLSRCPGVSADRHIVAVTSETSPLANNPRYLDSFYIDDNIGGRYSATSAVGGVILSVALGPDAFSGILEGAAEADRLALGADFRSNAALLDAMLGIVQRSVYGRPSAAVLPYAQALSRFPAHLQQLDMESNGKSADRNGKALPVPTGPVIFGEPGTNGQHSFYQLLHQGTDIVPLQFIGFAENQAGPDVEVDSSSSRDKLNANLVAQIVAFAVGKDSPDPNKRFPGGRPSTLIFGRKLDPKALGALLAHYENKVMFQGFAWNLNSFDQEGVQLGKVLAKDVLASGGPSNPLLAAYRDLVARA